MAALSINLVQLLRTSLRSRTALAAENLFLRKQLALYREREVKPRRASNPLRFTLVLLARWFAWQEALTIVQPATLLRWHREAFRLLWRWRSRLGRPRIPTELQRLISEMARDNPTWGEERIAAELLLKLGLRVSPRTVRRYMVRWNGGGGRQAIGQRWTTFVRNHAVALVACDFCVVVTATFRVLYVFVAMEIGSRRLLHVNATQHPTAAWTRQQFRGILAQPHGYRFVLHDRDSIYAPSLDAAVTAMGVRVLRAPVRSPMANAYCERLLGTLRRECLDILIPFGGGTCAGYFASGRSTTTGRGLIAVWVPAFPTHPLASLPAESAAIACRKIPASWRELSWVGSTTSTPLRRWQHDYARG